MVYTRSRRRSPAGLRGCTEVVCEILGTQVVGLTCEIAELGVSVATIYDVLDVIRESAKTTQEMGSAFERATRYFLRHDPVWRQRFSEVWLWQDSPVCGGPDTGIDIVARDADTDSYWAIQCKCYQESYYLQKGDIDSFFNEAGKDIYTGRIIVAATENWSRHALKSVDDWGAIRILPRDIAESPLDWEPFLTGRFDAVKSRRTHELMSHQVEAVDNVLNGFASADRGKLIMACGTGKTFTSLRLAEAMAPIGAVLFLAPSISLISQTLREWANQTKVGLRSFAVCSDAKVGAHRNDESGDISIHDLPYPATTDPAELARRMNLPRNRDAMTVVFSTYQSIQVIVDAQNAGLREFDLIICDEAHRTTGAKDIADDDESYFTKVHDNSVVKGAKRLYMTATPRIYGQQAKEKARELSYEVASMDDPEKYGEEFHRLGFGEAVERHLLTDYRVLVLTVSEDEASKSFQEMYTVEDGELPLPERAKVIGCWNGLATRGHEVGDPDRPHALRRAVAFSGSIKDSKQLKDKFEAVIEAYLLQTGADNVFRCEVDHVDGTMNAIERNNKLDWLREATDQENTCRILSNARCLSEGIDVPALDAVIFMRPRRSKVDIIQAVGRVMRRADEKDYGYIILPICVPAGVKPEDALDDNKNFEVVWEILQALRSHDERFDAMVNQIQFGGNSPVKVKTVQSETPETGGIGGAEIAAEQGDREENILQMALTFPIEEWQKSINAKIVSRVGTRFYWEDWANDVAKIAERHVKQITQLVDSGPPEVTQAFVKFLKGLQDSENSGVSKEDAIEMLAQHLITAPVFDALFSNYSFVAHNPVSIVMEEMLGILREHRLDAEDESLEKFYASVRRRVEGIDTDEGRQAVIKELYENFFSAAFRKTSDAMGIVYTPIEIVDFILHSVSEALEREFGNSLGDQGVHILDPFTGTGTFIVRMLQTGLIGDDQLRPKYLSEIHANEIVLLAYYIATINIEHAFHSRIPGEYRPFPGAVLTDTFEMSEAGSPIDVEMFVDNSERVLKQAGIKDIRVILGNPPYSIGQRNENDNNRNMSYPVLDQRIKNTYARQSSAGLKKGLYDSYIRAFRWASDRIGDTGIVCFVSNAGWLDGAGMDGFRKSLVDEFSSIYVFNLRGNQRTSGETSRKEGGKVFGSGSRTPIAITMLVKNPTSGKKGEISYHDIGDYLSRDEKLGIIADFESMSSMSWKTLKPDANGDWLSLRDPSFQRFAKIGDEKYHEPLGMFETYSLGLVSNRDVWAYGFSQAGVAANISSMIEFYNSEVERYVREGNGVDIDEFIDTTPSKIKWTHNLKTELAAKRPISMLPDAVSPSLYRPFCKQHVYFDRKLIERVYQLPRLFPTAEHENRAICATGIGASRNFSVLMTDAIPNLDTLEKCQCFPLYWYERQDGAGLFAGETTYVQHDGITDATLATYRAAYGDTISKEDIFYYTYGILHSPEYRERFGDNLRKELPRVPMAADFEAFCRAGRKLGDLHLGYESIEPWPLAEVVAPGAKPSYRVEKLRYPKDGKVENKSAIIVNPTLMLTGIPDKAYRYEINGQSALWWVKDRYQFKTDKDSGIVNDPNKWSDDPRYVVDLIARVARVSMETVAIVDALPSICER